MVFGSPFRPRRPLGHHRTVVSPGPNAIRRAGDRASPTGRPPTGILFVLRSGIPWEMLPMELGCGSGMTCWRRLRDWHDAGVWERLHRVLLDRLGRANAIDWSRAVVDSASVPAKRGQCGGA